MTNREAIAAILEREGYPKSDGRVKTYSDRTERYPHELDRRALREGALYQLLGHQLAYKYHHPEAHVDCGTMISADGQLLGQFVGRDAQKGTPATLYVRQSAQPQTVTVTVAFVPPIPDAPRPTPDRAPTAPELSAQDKAARGAVRLAILRLRAPCVVNAHELMNLAQVYWQVSLSPHRSEAQSKALQAKTRAVYRALEKRADCPEWLLA